LQFRTFKKHCRHRHEVADLDYKYTACTISDTDILYCNKRSCRIWKKIQPNLLNPKMQCKFEPYYQCTNGATHGDYCDEHYGIKCVVCGEPANRYCGYLGQFQCGEPLCPDCEGWEDLTKESGNWGFMNHRHRTKLSKE